MSSTIYIDTAAQAALARRIESLANNIANANTVGFRADGLKFDTIVSASGGANVSFPQAGRDFISTASGPVQRTGNSLDLAVRGNAWFSLMSPDGPVYTRDGRMELAKTGELRSVNGYPVLDVSGAPMFADASAGELSIAADGTITQNSKQIGAIGLFTIDPGARLSRYDNSSVLPDGPVTPSLDFATTGVLQGRLEQSNVEPIRELTRLIEVQRAFDRITAAMDLSDSTQQDAIRTLGSST